MGRCYCRPPQFGEASQLHQVDVWDRRAGINDVLGPTLAANVVAAIQPRSVGYCPVVAHVAHIRSRRVHGRKSRLCCQSGKRRDVGTKAITTPAELTAAAVPQQQVVLGFRSPEMRRLGEFGVA